MIRLRQPNKRIALLYGAGLLLLFVALALGLLLGSTPISPRELFRVLREGDQTSAAARILRYVRIPRTCAALLCGGALAASGAILQGVLANRLASPSIIGVNSGAGLAVTLCSAFGIIGGWQLSLCAFLGALFAVALVSIGARKFGASEGTVVLMGVAMNALFGAISDTVTTFFPELAIQNFEFRIGDFSGVTAFKLIPAAVIILTVLALLLTLSNELEVLSLGEERAKGLGLNTALTRVIFLLFAALLAGAAVSVAGLLSFVGLLVPHAIRRLSGTTRHLLPLCMLLGAGFVSLCDTLSRTIFAPYELPVGILMAFLGAPLFLYVLISRRGGHPHA